MFVGELARIDSLGANQRLIFTLPTIDGDGYSNVQIKLIVPTDYMDRLGNMILGRGREESRDDMLSEVVVTARPN